ncbi:drug resistance protein [Colletotrichum tofieldiae]|uniref:Drug resistance protein n=1 Tax=Colletotrichum tofieldiae TaxID=708197 RepID=A0A166XZ82_9PEZI|nr:drug resistance protein [Colletotrichum tofieldiae]GKT53090.1 drug resistance protein [Colletotrichum tofieldiae]GKT81073.1 drug resistance protein [Colletotrichum tofieldiae]GKT88515.1 drug resistance protein [Colletotrichum tofieldiae]
MSGRVSPSHHANANGGVPVPFIADPGPGFDSKQLPAAENRADVDDDVAESFPKLSMLRSILLTAVISTAGLLTVLNVQSVVILLPSLSEDIGIPPTRQQIVVSIYNISTGSLMLLWGRIADVYGRRLVYLIGSVLFTLSNLCLPFTRYEVPFHIVRFLQGMSGAALIPSGIGIIASTFPRGKARNNAYVCIAAVASVGSVLGNIFGGVIGGLLSWQWVFWVPAILAAVVTVIAYFITDIPHLRSPPSASTEIANSGEESRARSVDWIGGALVSCSLVLLLAAFTQANVIGWSTPWIPPLIAGSVLLLVGFCFWQRHLEKDPAREPLLRISMFKNLQFSALFVLVAFFYASFNSFLVFVTFFYQDYLDLSELDTTLRFLPAGIAGFLISFVVSPALSRIRAFYILVFGLVCGMASPFIMAIPAIPPETSYWAYGFPAMCLCFSIEIVWPVISLLIAARLPSADQGLGSGLLQSSNNVGRALGLAIATAVQTSAQGFEGNGGGFAGSPGFLYGVQAAQWTNVGFAAAALGIAIAFFRDLGYT